MKKEIFLDDLKRIELSLLDALDSYCKENGLRYFLAYGTLLGAIRHKGFIPWDDDIDVFMPRRDYNILIDSFNKKTIDSEVKLLSHSIDKNYCISVAKLINSNTVLNENVNLNFDIGVYIDIFPLDNLSDDIKSARHRLKKGYRYNEQYALKVIKWRKGRSIFKNLILMFGKLALIGKPVSRIVEELEQYCCETKADSFTNYVGVMTGIPKSYFKIFKKELFEQPVLLKFEGKEYPAPIGSDIVLREIYGDYMQLPPIDKQVSHHVFEAWYKD